MLFYKLCWISTGEVLCSIILKFVLIKTRAIVTSNISLNVLILCREFARPFFLGDRPDVPQFLIGPRGGAIV